jgi:hypothetical protein
MDEEIDDSPRLAPCIVMLDDPVEAPFLLRGTLIAPPSIEKPSDTLPTTSAALRSVVLLPK